MKYLITRTNDEFPNNELELENNVWYNLWEIRSAPFIPVNINDEVILRSKDNSFFEANFKTLIKHEFKCRENIINILRIHGYTAYSGDPYWNEKLHIESGFLLAYKFKNIKRIKNEPNMTNSTVLGTGWTRLD
jgi:hypothetical protein